MKLKKAFLMCLGSFADTRAALLEVRFVPHSGYHAEPADLRLVPIADIWREARKGVSRSAGKWSPGLAELTFVHLGRLRSS
jgi:hypothetical protein